MTCWITVHYPHPVPDVIPWVVYLTTKTKDLGHKMRSRDRVLFYCVEFPPTIKGKPVTRISKTVGTSVEFLPLANRPGGIVGIATVESEVRPKSELGIDIYDYGNSREWGFYVPCRDFRRGETISRERYRAIVGKGVAVRSGLYRIREDLFDRLLSELGQDTIVDAPPPAKDARTHDAGVK